MAEDNSEKTIHASCVCIREKAVLICGASGSGKSGLALQMIALGASLVSDDRTTVQLVNGAIIASAPKNIRGFIEARGIGILNAKTVASSEVVLVVDLDRIETKRLPESHSKSICDTNLPCLHKIEALYFPAAILQYLQSGRRDPS